MTIRSLTSLLLIFLLLEACAVREQPAEPGEAGASGDTVSIRTLSEAEVVTGAAGTDRQRLIADLLYAGLQSLDADRLLTPVDDNAHAKFMRVLAYDPDNEIALQGLQDILARYVQLAGEASRQGLFADAELMLERARFIDEDHPDIARASVGLQDEMNSGDLFFTLDGEEFSRHSERAQEQLIDIAKQAKQHGAFFLITAPNDDLARWMYSIMRDAVAGYRLRGNIELAGRTSIRLRMPQD
ncbi:MAG: hypothetical protein QGF90_04400 [Gammaproteobacteria bacterium]|jgi:hypothetical protein|nr:hypothetical protein [Gammaproteobacteria bacterium]|tara:strand:- start:21 stop:746 length:726 start_codon:yes stop_codon:yes gene_type:complete